MPGNRDELIKPIICRFRLRRTEPQRFRSLLDPGRHPDGVEPRPNKLSCCIELEA
jgi:hypothetical protein